MSRLRFATARALFEHFPRARERIKAAPTDEFPLGFLRGLLDKGEFEDAISFCAYLLARREAVWWGCRSVRALIGDPIGSEADALRAAESWARDPDEQRRRAAHNIAVASDVDNPLTWLAFAATWSGGSLAPSSPKPVPAPPDLTAHATRIAVLLGARLVRGSERASRMRGCIEDGIRISENGL